MASSEALALIRMNQKTLFLDMQVAADYVESCTIELCRNHTDIVSVGEKVILLGPGNLLPGDMVNGTLYYNQTSKFVFYS